MKKIIGLTGGIASGKSTVSDELKKAGIPVIDADRVSRGLLERDGEAYPAVTREFPQYVLPDGTIDRAGLGGYVFTHSDALSKLNAITHPIIVRKVSELAKACEETVIIDAPLLIEVGLHTICDEIWLVSADDEQRVERIVLRNGLSREQARDRIRNQMPEEEKRRFADLVVDNSGTVEDLYRKIGELKERLGK